MKYVLALDQGTTSSRAILFDDGGRPVAIAQREFPQYYPEVGWVEHDPHDIWSSQVGVLGETLAKASVETRDVAAIGITNQRETTLVWERTTGRPVYNAIVWQDRRTAAVCDNMKQTGAADRIRELTGLVVDPYFSATKVAWILDNVPGARSRAEAGELCFGTVDSWIVWRLTGGNRHITDVTNASRTMLFDIRTMTWSDELLNVFGIPRKMLPEVVPSSGVHAMTSDVVLPAEIPIAGIAGDQHAALFGQMCTRPGMGKNTYGTGCFVLMNTGSAPVQSAHDLVSTIAWHTSDATTYALEGSIFVAGALVQWLRDGLGIIKRSEDVEELAETVADNGGIVVVPAFTGLGAPHWDPHARGTIIGITRGTTAGHIARAALEAIAFQSLDVIRAMEADAGIRLAELRVDGGASRNNLLMQIQADLLGVPVVRPTVTETTALGAAYLAGLGVGLWESPDELAGHWQEKRRFEPNVSAGERDGRHADWQRAVERSRGWAGT